MKSGMLELLLGMMTVSSKALVYDDAEILEDDNEETESEE
jgi:hypothetical protein